MQSKLKPLVPPAPLRDLLRGVGAAAEISDELLSPAKSMLPAPIRGLLSDTAHAADRARRRTIAATRPGPDEIAAAAQAVVVPSEAVPVEAVSHVLSYALEKALEASAPDHLFISETVAAMAVSGALKDTRSHATPQSRMATLLLALTRAHVAGKVPGTGIALGETDMDRINLAVFAAGLWLLTARADDPAEEDRVLDLSIGLAEASRADVLAAFDSPDTLAGELAKLAIMI